MAHKYQIISQKIEDNILNGFYGTNKLPTEEFFINEFNVSRNTIRKAIDLLVKKGYIIPIQGSGMFIREVSHNGAINLENFRGLTEDFKNHNIETELLEFKTIQADKDLAKIMNCTLNTPLYFVKRLRSIDSIRWVVEYSYFNKELIPFLNREIVSNSIYDYIRSVSKKQLGYVDRILQAEKLSAEDAHLLHLKEGDPALVSVNKAMFKTGEIFDYSINIHHYRHARFLKLSNFII